MYAARHEFPCIGHVCLGRWRVRDTEVQSYYDERFSGQRVAWQQMCASCHAEPRAAELGHLPATATCSATHPVTDTPSARNKSRQPPGVKFLSHDDERKLAKPLWTEIANEIPRASHQGKLKWSSNKGSELTSKEQAAFLQSYPQLPFIQPKPANERARAILHKHGGTWTPDARDEAMACYECEAARIVPVLCMPELFARDDLERESNWQVKKNGKARDFTGTS
jgi:hypothetical protein